MISLRELVESQRQLQIKTYSNGDPSRLEGEARADFIRWNILALEDELHEALAEVGWKPWATSRHLNREAYLGELVDAFHFFMNLLIVAGIDGEELAQGYFQKRKVNAKRQEEGYDGVSGKDESGRALDEPCFAPRCELGKGHEGPHSTDGIQWTFTHEPAWTPMHGVGSKGPQ